MTVVKTLVQLVITILAGIVPALTAGPLDAPAWINIVALGAGVVMVYNAANIPGWPYAKLIASGVAAIAVLLLSAITDNTITPAEIVQMIIAFAGAAGVGALPNGGATTTTHA